MTPADIAARAGRTDRFAHLPETRLEILESRVLLAGDHPSFPSPFNPAVGTVINLDPGGFGLASGQINPAGDDDVFRFTVPSADFVTVLANTAGLESALNTRVEVYDGTGRLVAQGNDNGVLSSTTPNPAPDGWTGFIAQPGIYYARVLGENASTGRYQIRVDARTTSVSVPIPAPEGEFIVSGQVFDLQREVVYRLDIPADAGFDSLATIVATPGSMTPIPPDQFGLDTRLEIYDASGVLVVSDSQTAYLTSAYVGWKVSPNERFYVRIRSDQLGGPQAVGEYGLVIDLAAWELDEPVSPVTRRGQDPTHSLRDPYDSDLFRFQAQGTGLTFITVIDTNGEGGFGVRVYDDQGELLAFDDDFVGRHPQLEFQGIGGRLYYVVVDSFEPPLAPILGAPYTLFIEAHHTFDSTTPIDDHENTPAGTPDQVRRGFERATPVVFDTLLPVDADGNPRHDHSYVASSILSGRIQEAGDTDVFQFTAPLDMLGNYNGNDDNAGTALYVGGAFSAADPGALNLPIQSRNMAIWDAGDWWFAGPQNDGLGFRGVPDPLNPGQVIPPVIYTTIQLGTFLYVGGQFELVTSTNENEIPLRNLAAWGFDPFLGRFRWFRVDARFNGAVRAIATFQATPPDPMDPPLPTSFFVGGDFTEVEVINDQANGIADRIPANHIAGNNGVAGWFEPGGGVNNTVYALTVFDPADPGPGREAQPGPPPLPAVADPPNPPPVLMVGGAFDRAGGAVMRGLVSWNGTQFSGLAYGQPVPAPGFVEGVVRSLRVFDPPPEDPTDPESPDAPASLYIAGELSAAGGITANNIVRYGNPDPTQDPMNPVYTPRLLWEAFIDDTTMANGVNGPVLTLTSNGGSLYLGGAFTVADPDPMEPPDFLNSRVAVWNGLNFLPVGSISSGEVRTLTFVSDAQEPGANGTFLYAGGTFTVADFNDVGFVARFNGSAWQGLNSGVDGPANALIAYDDGIAGAWDRNDLASTRPYLFGSPSFGGFSDLRIRILDSEFNTIYANNTLAFPFPEPTGALDPSAGPGVPQPLRGPGLVGGETYYIEVSNIGPGPRSTGRYEFTLNIDTVPPDLNGDGTADDTISIFVEEPDAGAWSAARRITVDTNDPGDGDTTALGIQARQYSYPRTPFSSLGSTPSGFRVTHFSDIANLQTIDDTDLYYFRANADGYAELRVNTTGIATNFREEILDFNTGMLEVNLSADTISSRLASRIRVFNNDRQEVYTSTFNPALGGELDQTNVGTFGAGGAPLTFFHRDARAVVPVRAGEVYFVQVESAQRDAFLENPDLVDWRYAIGGYQLIVNSIADFDPDFSDDHANVDVLATPIPINLQPGHPQNGRGVVNGVIDNLPTNPTDFDAFLYHATGTGQVVVTAEGASASNLAISVDVFSNLGGLVASGSAPPGSPVELGFFGSRGEQFFIVVGGSGGSEGAYTLTVAGRPYVDDFADVGSWIDATPLVINPFLGSAQVNGSIEEAGDNDLFSFVALDWDIAFATVTSTSGEQLDPVVRVYETSANDLGLALLLQINTNDNAPGLGSAARARFSVSPGRTYYVVVEGADPEVHLGRYNLTINQTPTDDHPDFADHPMASALTFTNDAAGFAQVAASGEIEEAVDDDYFRFSPPAGGPVTINFGRTSGNLDPIIRLLDASGADVPGSPARDSGGSGDISFTFIGVRGQTYYVVIDVDTSDDGGPSPDLGTLGTYAFSVLAPPADDHANDGEFPLATPIVLSPTTGIAVAQGIIRPNIDTDLFRFTTRASGNVSISLTTPASTLDGRVVVYNSAFQAIHTASGDSDTASLSFSAGAAGEIYYVLVATDAGVPGSGQTGAYTLTVTGRLSDGPPPGPDNDDHADIGEFPSASPIGLDARTGDGSATGIINSVGDTDLFTFVTPTLAGSGSRPVYIQVTTPSGGLVDGTVRIFNSSFVEIAQNSAGIPGATAAVTLSAPGNSRFYVLVEPVGINTGSYTVRVDAEPAVHFLYYPEGYSTGTIDEFVPLVNANSFDVTFTIVARYETGTRDQVLVQSALIPANSRGGVTLTTRTDPLGSMTRRDTPYAIEIQSDGQLGATFSHYDFGITTGENFTSRLSNTWTFAEARRDTLNFRDFIVYYNPNSSDANLAVTLFYDDGAVVTFNRTVAAFRRSGINFETDSATQRPGRFGVRITSDQPIVAAMSSYDVTNGRGYGLLGNPDGGTTTGVIPSVKSGGGVDSSVSILNSSSTTAAVTLTFSYSLVNLPDLVRMVSVQPGGRRTFTLAQLGVVDDQPAGLRYSSTAPVTVSVVEYQNGDGDATSASSVAGTTALFGDAFVNPAFAGTTYIENIGIFNPASTPLSITLTFLFADGTSFTSPAPIIVAPGRFNYLSIDQNPAILNRPDPTAFSIRLDAATPFVAGFTHYDLFLNGGWGTLGAFVGLTNSLSSIG